jgi:hypothetical protein
MWSSVTTIIMFGIDLAGCVPDVIKDLFRPLAYLEHFILLIVS